MQQHYRAYLLSSLWQGEYTAAVTGYVLLMLQALIASWAPLRPYRLNLMWTMAEDSAIPWRRLLAIGLIAILLFAVAAWQTEKQDF